MSTSTPATTAYRYEEIASVLRERIRDGVYPGGRLASERTLTAEFGVQRGTVRRALAALEAEGLVYRHQTRGTFTAPPRPAAPDERFKNVAKGAILLAVGRASDTTAPLDIVRGLTDIVGGSERAVIWRDTPATVFPDIGASHAEADVPDVAEIAAQNIAAVALWPHVPADIARLRALRDACPLVLLDRRVSGFESDFVGVADQEAGAVAARYLLSKGHRRIGFFGALPYVSTVEARLHGVKTALAEAGITFQPEWARFQSRDYDALDTSLVEMLLAGSATGPDAGPLTAIVASNDTKAAAILRYLRATGRRSPDDVAVIGFGNAPATLLDALGLTTVAQPWEEMGREAGRLLLARLGDTAPAASQSAIEIELPVRLIPRESA